MRACRVDANQKVIVKAFRDGGFSVLHVHTLKNCCDVMVSYKGYTAAIEIKDGDKPLSKQKLTTGEQKFKDEWQGKYYLVNSVSAANAIIHEMKFNHNTRD